jgi:CPA1 family monovalent cation:H+ antiporter
MEFNFETGSLLLLIAAVVAMLTRRLRLPYSVGLVVAGIALAILPFAPKVGLTKDLIFTVLLPPLLFEAALFIHWKELRRNFPVIVVLATFGVLLSAGVTAAGMHYLVHWPWLGALVFGVLIAATDPVSVIAIFKEAKAHGRLLVLIEAESLFNDGTAAVAFGVVVALASGQQLTALEISSILAKTIGGGVLCGGVVALGALLLAGRTDDHLVEITVTTVAAYGSFLLAEHFGWSGVLATITAGLVMGNFKSFGAISNRGKEAVQAFWEYAAFVANSLISPDRNAGSPPEFRHDLDSSRDGDCAGDAGQGGCNVSLLSCLLGFLVEGHDETSACPVLGRIAGSGCAGSRPRTAL